MFELDLEIVSESKKYFDAIKDEKVRKAAKDWVVLIIWLDLLAKAKTVPPEVFKPFANVWLEYIRIIQPEKSTGLIEKTLFPLKSKGQ